MLPFRKKEGERLFLVVLPLAHPSFTILSLWFIEGVAQPCHVRVLELLLSLPNLLVRMEMNPARRWSRKWRWSPRGREQLQLKVASIFPLLLFLLPSHVFRLAAQRKAKADEDDAQAGDAADAGAEVSNKKQKVER
jgi:hypothetical protein